MAPAFATVMPSGWEAVVSPEGKTYYIDHNTRSTHWSPPAAATTARAVVVPAPARTRTCIAIGTMVVFALSVGASPPAHARAAAHARACQPPRPALAGGQGSSCTLGSPVPIESL